MKYFTKYIIHYYFSVYFGALPRYSPFSDLRQLNLSQNCTPHWALTLVPGNDSLKVTLSLVGQPAANDWWLGDFKGPAPSYSLVKL